MCALSNPQYTPNAPSLQQNIPVDHPVMMCYEQLCSAERHRAGVSPREMNAGLFATITETIVPKDLLTKVSVGAVVFFPIGGLLFSIALV